MFRERSCAVLLAALLTGASAPAAAAQSAQQIFRDASPSVVLLTMEDAKGRAVSLGTGFFVKEGVIAANLHLLEGANRGYLKHIGQKERLPIAGIVAVDRERDLVLLAVPESKAPPLPLGDDKQAAVGDTIYAIGNPRGFEGTLSQGIVSGIRESNARPLLQITAPLSLGSSGGPVLNTEGKVIGIALATLGTGQNLNFAVPVSDLRALLAKIGTVRPLSAPAAAPAAAVRSGTEGVAGALFVWERYSPQGRHFSFSLQNRLDKPIKTVYYLVAFYDRHGQPVHVESGRYDDVIPPGLAKRIGGTLEVYTSDLVDKVEIKVIRFDFVQ